MKMSIYNFTLFMQIISLNLINEIQNELFPFWKQLEI